MKGNFHFNPPPAALLRARRLLEARRAIHGPQADSGMFKRAKTDRECRAPDTDLPTLSNEPFLFAADRPRLPAPALHCTALHCAALRCTAPHCAALHHTGTRALGRSLSTARSAGQSPGEFAVTSHQVAVGVQPPIHCTALHCATLHCTALHCAARKAQLQYI